jgi:PEP-CTERM motif
MEKFRRLSLVVSLAMVLFAPTFGNATTILFDGSGTGFGLTYELIITDANDADGTTYTGEIKITGTYTGSETFIAAVDFKPDSNTLTSASLISTTAGSTGGWTTDFNTQQAAQNCDPSQAATGFICSFDTGTNDQAPVANGGAVNYDWKWNFSMTGTLDPGHLGARFNNAGDTDNGQIISISEFGSATPSGKVPEPSALILLGAGLLASRIVLKKLGTRNA